MRRHRPLDVTLHLQDGSRHLVHFRHVGAARPRLLHRRLRLPELRHHVRLRPLALLGQLGQLLRVRDEEHAESKQGHHVVRLLGHTRADVRLRLLHAVRLKQQELAAVHQNVHGVGAQQRSARHASLPRLQVPFVHVHPTAHDLHEAERVRVVGAQFRGHLVHPQSSLEVVFDVVEQGHPAQDAARLHRRLPDEPGLREEGASSVVGRVVGGGGLLHKRLPPARCEEGAVGCHEVGRRFAVLAPGHVVQRAGFEGPHLQPRCSPSSFAVVVRCRGVGVHHRLGELCNVGGFGGLLLVQKLSVAQQELKHRGLRGDGARGGRGYPARGFPLLDHLFRSELPARFVHLLHRLLHFLEVGALVVHPLHVLLLEHGLVALPLLEVLLDGHLLGHHHSAALHQRVLEPPLRLVDAGAPVAHFHVARVVGEHPRAVAQRGLEEARLLVHGGAVVVQGLHRFFGHVELFAELDGASELGRRPLVEIRAHEFGSFSVDVVELHFERFASFVHRRNFLRCRNFIGPRWCNWGNACSRPSNSSSSSSSSGSVHRRS
mmetsp:Transcript_76165/g.149174  ORF Transcript_76165/g.149174 Transcript_76165/m.149174 type:complete len:546 (-) Transcript_76165:316-1953(-)